MFILVVGSTASGKEEVTQYLVQHHGSTRLYMDPASSPNNPAAFGSAKQLMDYITPRWRQNYVSTDITNPIDIYLLRKRPFVLVVGVDAPTGLRYKRHCAELASSSPGAALPTLEQFVDMDDERMYRSQGISAFTSLSISNAVSAQIHELNLKQVLSGAHVTITNIFPTKQQLLRHLDKLNLLSQDRIRPSWDTYFMLLSELASHRSNCMKRKVGCILVRDHQIIATGYNGTPKGISNCNEGGCPRCNDGTPCGVSLDHCLCIHAEENALLEAGRGRVGGSGEGVALYCNTCPCLGCAKKIVQVGVKEVVYSKGYGMDELTLKMFKEANVKVRQHMPPVLSMEIGSP